MAIDGDSTQTSRARLLAAGKSLFGRLGYEQTSTATIARESGSSESQLIRYFGGKAGLLEAIFNEAWFGLAQSINAIVAESSPSGATIVNVLGHFIEVFSGDRELAFLFLFEGRRIRGSEVTISKGFTQFFELFCSLVSRAQSDGALRTDIPGNVLASALLGAAEGMIRDRMLAERNGTETVFDEAIIRKAFDALVRGLG
ncbi:MAG: TetR/AcrR family transcriptional regulator [Acidobacteria bacterium]|nr:TetR/AcrR family transcriptional regulator [Acidobacteriota bacterium]